MELVSRDMEEAGNAAGVPILGDNGALERGPLLAERALDDVVIAPTAGEDASAARIEHSARTKLPETLKAWPPLPVRTGVEARSTVREPSDEASPTRRTSRDS